MRALLALVILAAANAPALAQQAQLLSFRNLAVPENGYVASFQFETWRVRVLAVCRIPAGWTITAENTATPAGFLSGHGSHGAAFVGRDQLDRLDNLVMIVVDEYRTRDEAISSTGERIPASFKGVIHVGVYGSDANPSPVALEPDSIMLREAGACPPLP
jgi:hypothetical protein